MFFVRVTKLFFFHAILPHIQRNRVEQKFNMFFVFIRKLDGGGSSALVEADGKVGELNADPDGYIAMNGFEGKSETMAEHGDDDGVHISFIIPSVKPAEI